jgi:hypothetical protein
VNTSFTLIQALFTVGWIETDFRSGPDELRIRGTLACSSKRNTSMNLKKDNTIDVEK